ncbi:MAG: antitoxin [Chloroflexi bacterium]|nr:antitoxin [Chloroflexota bacterium]
MKATIDSAGRLVIPSSVRRQAGLRPGMPLDVRYRDGVIEVEPAPLPVRLERHGHLLVAVPEAEIEPLTANMVEATREAIRHGRGDLD